MKNRALRTYRFNVPSVLSLDWLFEFRCVFDARNTQETAVIMQEDTIGGREWVVPADWPTWNKRIWVWEQCRKLALEYAVRVNDRESRKTIGLPLEQGQEQE